MAVAVKLDGEARSIRSSYTNYMRSRLDAVGIGSVSTPFPKLEFGLSRAEAPFTYRGEKVIGARIDLFFQQLVQYDSNKMMSAATTYMLQQHGVGVDSAIDDLCDKLLTQFMDRFVADWRSVNP